MNNFLKKLTEKMFRVKGFIKKFNQKYPDEEVIVAGGAKGIQGVVDEEVSYNPKWITSLRTVIILTSKRLYTNKWDIELENIVEAKLIKIKQLYIKGFVLKVKTNDNKFYQFGLQYDSSWIDQKVLDLKIEDGKVKMSIFSLLLRVILLIMFLLMLYFK